MWLRFIRSVCLFSEAAFSVIDLFCCFPCLYFIYFCSDIYDFFPSTDFRICSSLSSCFRCTFRLFIWDFSFFLKYDCIAINFPPRTAFTVSHRFWIIFLFSFVSGYLFTSSLISSVIHWSFSSILFSLHVSLQFFFFFL